LGGEEEEEEGGLKGYGHARIIFQCLSFKIKENISHIPDVQIQ
jgi:hypothetical protein